MTEAALSADQKLLHPILAVIRLRSIFFLAGRDPCHFHHRTDYVCGTVLALRSLGMPMWVRVVVSIAGTAVAMGLIAAGYVVGHDTSSAKNWFKAAAMWWTVIPPAWFLIELVLYKSETTGPDFERFKLTQERMKDMWIGLAAAAAIFVGLKDIVGG